MSTPSQPMGSFWHRNCLDQQLADRHERNYAGSGAKNHGQTVPTMEARADLGFEARPWSAGYLNHGALLKRR